MASRQTDAVVQALCELADAHAQLSDGQLLARFAADRDERAFETLLRRHAPLVYGVCRNVLRHEQDAEDAFQGTFLVLVRLAGSIREEKALASWLYRVAYRVATKARRAAARRRQKEEQTARPSEDRLVGELGWRELQGMLDEELNRLPEKYRSPFVLCCLTGMSKSEAAAELGWKEGTVSSRLAHARKLIQTRLARRGVALSAVLTGLAVAQNAPAATAVPAGLLATTQKSALAFAAGDSLAASAAGALARSTVRGMGFARAKIVVAVLAVIALVGGAATAFQRAPAPEPPDLPPEFVAAPAPVPREPDRPQPAPGTKGGAESPVARMSIGGTVAGPDGKPVPGARVAVVAGRRRLAGDFHPNRLTMKLLSEGRADEQGRFHFTLPHEPADSHRLTAVAFAPGFAVSDNGVDPAKVALNQHTLPIQLARTYPLRVRLTDDAGRPAKGVTVHVLGMLRDGDDGVLVLSHEPPVPIPGWPGPLTSDDKGEFAIPNVGPNTKLHLQARDERFANGWLVVSSGKQETAEPVVIALGAPRFLEGKVIAEDTGKPLAGATVVVGTDHPNHPPGFVSARTNSEGRYRIRTFTNPTHNLWVYPPPDQPYISLRQDVTWPTTGELRYALDVTVPKGVLIRGKVREAGSGRAIPGVTVWYEWANKDNPYRKAMLIHAGARWDICDARTNGEGEFSMTVPLGPGTLLAKAAEPDYIHVETSSGQLLDGQKAGGTPYFADAILPMAHATSTTLTPTLTFRRGVTVRGRAVGSDGKPVAAGLLLCPTFIPTGCEMKGRTLAVTGGRFEVPGCEPGGKVTVRIFDPQKDEGAIAELNANPDAEPEVRLSPCVTARVKLVDKAGKTATGLVLPYHLLRPGDEINASLRLGTTPEIIVWNSMAFGWGHESTRVGVGEFTIPHLIPNAPYLLRVDSPGAIPKRPTFTAPASGPHDMTVTIEPRPVKPPR